MLKTKKRNFILGMLLSLVMLLSSFFCWLPLPGYAAVTLDQIIDRIGFTNSMEIFNSLKLLTRLNDDEIDFVVSFAKDKTKEYLFLVTPAEKEILNELGITTDELKQILGAVQSFARGTGNLADLRNGLKDNDLSAAETMANEILRILPSSVKESLKNSEEEIIGAVLEINRFALNRLRTIGKMGESAIDRIISGSPTGADQEKLAEIGITWENLKKILDLLTDEEKTMFKNILLKLAYTPGTGGTGGSGGGAEVIFDDIIGHWAQGDIEYMYKKGYVKGIGNKKFGPDNYITRAEFATLLQRILNLNPATNSNFKDVSSGEWYYGSVNAAAYAKLVNGYPDGNFKPKAKISREEMGVMVIRALAYRSNAVNLTEEQVENLLAPFTDKAQISPWAKPFAAKAVEVSIVKGRSADLWSPQANATRAEGIVMLKRLVDKLGK